MNYPGVSGGKTVDVLLILGVALLAFANGANDNFKGVATLWGSGRTSYPRALAWATAFTFFGSLAAACVAITMSREITPMPVGDATGANLVAAVLVGLASFVALPVSTTHVTTGAILGIGLRRRTETHWRRVREILLAWLGTLPMGAFLGAVCYFLLSHR